MVGKIFAGCLRAMPKIQIGVAQRIQRLASVASMKSKAAQRTDLCGLTLLTIKISVLVKNGIF